MYWYHCGYCRQSHCVLIESRKAMRVAIAHRNVYSLIYTCLTGRQGIYLANAVTSSKTYFNQRRDYRMVLSNNTSTLQAVRFPVIASISSKQRSSGKGGWYRLFWRSNAGFNYTGTYSIQTATIKILIWTVFLWRYKQK